MTEIIKRNFEQYEEVLLLLTKDVEETKFDETRVLKKDSIVKFSQVLSASNTIFVEDVNNQIWEIELSDADMNLLGTSNPEDSFITTEYFIVLDSKKINYMKSKRNKIRLGLSNFSISILLSVFFCFIISIVLFVLCYVDFYSYFFLALGALLFSLFFCFYIAKKLDDINNYYCWAFPYFENAEVPKELEFFNNKIQN